MSQFQLDLGGRPPNAASSRAEELLADLNPPQRAAVLATSGPVLILAGAGSGKTRALTRKIAYLVAVEGYAPWEILAVTFTNKAAAEMRERAAHLLGDRAADLWLGTFHSVGVKMLRRHGELLGVPRGFVIYDQSDQVAMVGRCMKALDISDKMFTAKNFLGYIEAQKRECRGPDHPEVPRKGPIERRAHQVYEVYERAMRAAGAVDFSDLIWLPYRIVTEHPLVAREYQGRWRYLLVDEFQDTNKAQYRLLKAVLNPARRICVVGDDDQSIYRWRGADVQNILGFHEDLPGAEVFRLEQNYRSTSNILTVAGALIAQNAGRHGKTLWTEHAAGPPVVVYPAHSDRDEAEYVVKQVQALRAETSLGEMAIFYRTNAQSRAFEDVLRSRGIPYRVVGGLRFYDRAEVKDVIAYLRVLVNPADVISLERIVNRPARGIGATTLERCREHAEARGVGLWQAIDELAQRSDATGRRLAPFAALMVSLRAEAESGTALSTALAVLDATRYLALLEEDLSVEAQVRAENVTELIGAIGEYAERSPGGDLAAFLDEVSLVSDLDQTSREEDAVLMMTAHTAKGLEFDVVFVTGFEEGLFPHFNSSDSAAGVEEERRLAYVAMTRAREHLFVTHAATRRRFGQTKHAVASRFLRGLPAASIRVDAGRQAAAPRHGGWGEEPSHRWGSTGSHGAATRGDDADLVFPIDALPDYESESQDPGDAPRPGSAVFHTQFGEGRILDLTGQGDRAKAKVRFTDGEVRTIMARFLAVL